MSLSNKNISVDIFLKIFDTDFQLIKMYASILANVSSSS